MKKPGTTLVIAGIIVLLGAILFTPTYNLIRGNTQGGSASSDNEAVIEEEDGAVYAEGELVSDFPDIPVFPGAKVIKSTETNSDNQYGYIAIWEIQDKQVNDVLRFYLSEGKKRNWTIVHSPDLSPKSSDQYIEAKIEGRKAYISVEKEEDNKTISIRVDFPDTN